jgi:transposase
MAGQQNVTIAEKLGVSRPTVQLWRRRVREQGIGEVWQIAPGRGRKPLYDQATRERIIQATLQSKPQGMTHWSCRRMAQAQQVSSSTVNRLWQLHNLKPHLSRTFKLSRDKKFLEKLTDVVGLYLNPPQKALVLCLDEKSQIQALDRTPPGLPLKKGRCGTMTHDYKRNGTTTLFAALNVLDRVALIRYVAVQPYCDFLACGSKERVCRRQEHGSRPFASGPTLPCNESLTKLPGAARAKTRAI